jgi:outer membrane protein assembly factor BamB
MSSQSLTAAPVDQLQPPAPSPGRPRVWPAVALVGLYWAFFFASPLLGLTMFPGFLARMAAGLLLALAFSLWWSFNRGIPRRDRLVGFAGVVLGGVAAALLSDRTVPAMILVLMGLPLAFTAWAVWLVVARRFSARTRLRGVLAALALVWGAFLVIRMQGLGGEGRPEVYWRWSPTPEDLYLQKRAAEGWNVVKLETTLTPRHGDWPGFRGPQRDGVVRGVRIATDWSATPPTPAWKRLIGPAWSSVVIVGDRLFTQEQVGEFEAVVCLDAATGREVWSHQDRARWHDGQADAGPRATPTFADGRLYALGATGILNCLDAVTGERKWSRNLATDAGAKAPVWGFGSSPLVVNDLVIVFAGGEGGKSLLAYNARTGGSPVWTAPAGSFSYSSPQLAWLEGKPQVLFLGDRGLTAFDPATGSVLWEHRIPSGGPGLPRTIQPHRVGDTQFLIGSEADFGTALIDVQRDGGAWTTTQRWAARALKPSFNDFVVSDGSVYGFDGAIFCCLDLKSGKRRWKDGRYGHGQVLLLAEQRLLLVVTEQGEAVLLAANPERHEELGRFQAVEGKTWNHPVIAHGRLYVRNAREIACYELKPGTEQGK